MTVILMWPAFLHVLYFLAGMSAGTELSAMTGTAVFRWLPCPHLRGCPFSLSDVSVVKKPSSSSTWSDSRQGPSRFPVPQLMHHFPDGLVAFPSKLALYLQSGNGPLGACNQEHCHEPVENRKFAALASRCLNGESSHDRNPYMSRTCDLDSS